MKRREITMIYGTAWKNEQTANLVHKAIESGFRAIDVAAQPKHYREDLVGDGVRESIEGGYVKREDLYIQTKFSWATDPKAENMPYDPRSTIADQVKDSVKGSLLSLRPRDNEGWEDESYIDCVLLHSPLPTWKETLEAWKALEDFVPHQVRKLGISNCHISVLRILCTSQSIKVRPTVVQNRFYQKTSFDSDVRLFCRDNNITYQAFRVLTANGHLLVSEPVERIAKEAKVKIQPALYALVSSLGSVSVLNGTSNHEHMVYDIAGFTYLQTWKCEEANLLIWKECLEDFKKLVCDA